MIRTGAALGYTPDQSLDMTAWQFMMCVEGYNAAQGGAGKNEPPAMSGDEFRELLARNSRYLN